MLGEMAAGGSVLEKGPCSYHTIHNYIHKATSNTAVTTEQQLACDLPDNKDGECDAAER